MKSITLIIWLVSVIVCSLQLHGQSVSYKRYSTEDGLPHNVGFDIMQDSKGFIWIGTDNGLVRFDGTEFKTYLTQNGLNSPYIITLSEDMDGTIWIGSYKQDLNYLSNDSIFSIHDSYISRIQAPRIYRTKHGSIIYNDEGANRSGINMALIHSIATSNHKTQYWTYLEGTEFQTSRLNSLTPKGIGTKSYARNDLGLSLFQMIMYQRKSGEIIFASSLGLLKLENDTTISPLSIPFLPSGHISAIFEDDDGYLWLGIGKKVYLVKDRKLLAIYDIPIKGDQIIKLCKTASGNIFALDDTRKTLIRLDIFSNLAEDITPFLGLKADISYITCDNESNLWFTTNGDGLYCVYNQQFKNYNQRDGLVNPFVNTISQDEKGNLFAGTKAGLAVYQDGSWKAGSSFLTEESGELNQLFRNNAGALYASSINGLHRISKVNTFWKRQSVIYTIDRYDTVWARTAIEGIKFHISDPDHIKINDSQNYKKEFSASKLITMEEFTDGSMLLGTTEGLYIADRNFVDPRHFTMESGLAHNQINDILVDPDGVVWLATEGGISRWDGKIFQNLTTADGLLSNSCKVMLQDDRKGTWVGTARGLHYINEDQILPFTTHMGLVTEDINCLFLDSKNNLWVGTSLGISVLPSRSIPQEVSPPPIYFNTLYLDDSLISFSESISIRQNQQLEVNYTAISYVESDRIRFQYRLKPEADWEEVKGRSLPLANLQADNYELQIRARKINSDWSSPVCFSFEVLAPWWQRPIFWLLGIVLFMAIGSLVIWLYLQRLKRKEKAKTLINKRFAELELQALQAQINPHFIFNALGVIQQFIVENDTETANRYLVRFARLMRMFLDSSKDKFISLEEEVKMLKLYIEMEKLCYEDKFSYQIEVDPALDKRPRRLPSMLIQPFVENAIHHGLLLKEKPGNLQVKFQLQENEIVCSIIDDGVGRKKALELKQQSYVSYKSRGMQITEERLKVLNDMERAQYRFDIQDLTSNEGDSKGTHVTIFIPLTSRPAEF